MSRFERRISTSRGSWSLLHAYSMALALAATGLGAGLIEWRSSLGGPLWAIAILAAVAVCAERQPVRISTTAEITVSFLPLVFAAVVYGPLAAMAIGAASLTCEFRRPYIRWAIWTCQRSIAGGLAGLAAVFAFSGESSFGRLLAGVTAAVITEMTVDAFLGSLTVAIRRSGSWIVFLRTTRPVWLATVPLYTPVIVLLAFVYQEVSAWGVLLFFAPAFAAQNLHRLYREERQATQQLSEANARLERANLSFASALVAALDARDRYTAGHSAAVAVYARDIAAHLGLSEDERQLAHLCGLVHDIGKVGLPPGILEKAGVLTLEERIQMEEHAIIGERILSNVEDYAEIAKIVRHHHERIDGAGYPDGLRGADIPLISRIIGVADAYNAMTSGRPYRDAMPSVVARRRLTQAAGSQFDVLVVSAFERILAAETEMYLSGARADFALEAQSHPEFGPELTATAA